MAVIHSGDGRPAGPSGTSSRDAAGKGRACRSEGWNGPTPREHQPVPATDRATWSRDNKMQFVLTPKSVGESFPQEIARKGVFGYSAANIRELSPLPALCPPSLFSLEVNFVTMGLRKTNYLRLPSLQESQAHTSTSFVRKCDALGGWHCRNLTLGGETGLEGKTRKG